MLDAASQTARHGALLLSEPERGVLSVRGPERATWLNGVVTPEVAALPVGKGVFGLVLSKQGKIQTDFLLAVGEDRLLLAVAPGTTAVAHGDLERMLVMEDAEIADVSAELATLSLHGARSVELASLAAARAGGTAAELDRTGLGGALLFVPRAALDSVVQTLLGEGAVLASRDAWLALRVERGVGEFGVDYGPGDNPHEAALERRAISWSKGCYLGQEAVFMQDARGKLKRRSSLLAVTGAPPAAGSPVLSESGEAIGEVTSGAAAAMQGESRALARLKAPHFETGSTLSIAGVAAVVLERPV